MLAREGQRLVGAVPLYLKTNSYGEFIFDWGWANAAHRSGVRYYPKLVAAIPFTPVTGQRLPIDPEPARRRGRGRHRRDAARDPASSPTTSARRRCISCSARRARRPRSRAAEYLPRLSMQFHWHNRAERPFESFDDFLTTFRSRNRKQVRKERQTAAAHGLTFRTATGAELDDRDWDALHAFYLANIARHGGIPYLNERFFRASRARRWRTGWSRRSRIAAPNRSPGRSTSRRGAHLYGRYWGCLDDFQMLHFELCYYRLIERAIERRYTLFEAGAQGEHKLKRGLAPAFTHSAHWIRDPGLGGAIAAFIEREADRGR